MTQEEIKIFIDKFEAFEELVDSTLRKLQKVSYHRWSTDGYSTSIRIDDDSVVSSYEDRFGEYNTVEFPANWLLISDEDLILTATIDDKIKTEEAQRIKLEREEAAQKSREDRY